MLQKSQVSSSLHLTSASHYLHSCTTTATNQKTANGRPELHIHPAGQVRHNLHIVLCFTEGSQQLLKTLSELPSLLSCFTAVHIPHWSRDTLELVAKRHLQNQPKLMEHLPQLSSVCVAIHLHSRDRSAYLAGQSHKF